jgi:hypothetical protein
MREYGIENWRSLGAIVRSLTQSTTHHLAAPPQTERRKQVAEAFVAWRAGHRGAAS